MKRLLVTLFSFIWIMEGVFAKNPEYLFDEFKQAVLISKEFNQFAAVVNYSFMHNQFLFIDTHDNNLIKLIDPAMEIRTIKVDNRIFIISDQGKVKEVLQQEPLITLQYKGKTKPEGKDAGYGGKSETSAIESYGYIHSGGQTLKLNTGGYLLIGVDFQYEIDRNGKAKSFMFPAKFVKIYPKSIQGKLDQYMEEQAVDFKEPEQVVSLYNYAEELVRQEQE